MGGGSWSSTEYTKYASDSSYATKSVKQIYSSKLNQALDPKGVKVRESRDSPDNPKSTPLIFALDVTGSMDPVLDSMVRKGLNKLVTEIHNRKPVTDPHVMCMAVGDMEVDSTPLQVTQFEADLRIAKQLEMIWPENGGGGNDHESYTLPWYFALNHTVADNFEKRGKKGYIFTFGDENPNPGLPISHFERVFGYTPQAVPDSEELLKMVSEKYDVFHLMVTQGNYFQRAGDQVKKNWEKLLGSRAILLPHHEHLAEVIVSTIQMNEGVPYDQVIDSWDKKTKKILESIPEFAHVVDLS